MDEGYNTFETEQIQNEILKDYSSNNNNAENDYEILEKDSNDYKENGRYDDNHNLEKDSYSTVEKENHDGNEGLEKDPNNNIEKEYDNERSEKDAYISEKENHDDNERLEKDDILSKFPSDINIKGDAEIIDDPPSSSFTSISTMVPTNHEDECKTTELPEIIVMPDDNDISDISSISSNDSSSSEDEKKKKQKQTKKKLKEKLKESKREFAEVKEQNQKLKNQLKEETDAKERLEGQLSKLQSKYQDQLKDEEALRSQLHHKDDYCSNLERKSASLEKDIANLRIKLSEEQSIDDVAEEKDEEQMGDINTENEETNQKLTTEISVLKEKLLSTQVLVQSYISQIGALDAENTVLKNKVDHQKESSEDDKQDISSLVEEKVQARLKEMEQCLVDQSQLQSKIKVLESESLTLKEDLKEEQNKYAEALVTLKQVQDAYGEMPDALVAKYKQEIESLKDRLRIAEESNNEGMITGLRQEVLDTQLTYERAKQSHRDEIDLMKSQLNEKDNVIKELKAAADASCKLLSDTQNMLNTSQELASERMQKITELKTKIISLNDTVQLAKKESSEKDAEISGLTKQLSEGGNLLEKEHREKKSLMNELEEMNSIKRRNQRMEEELEEIKHQMKLRGMKNKYIKKQMKDLVEQKQKADSIHFVLPGLQKKLDSLEEENIKLQNEINERDQQEEDRNRQLECEKRDEEERLRKEKEQWERSLLGMGKCELYHEEEIDEQVQFSESFSRPHSAPPLKPRPPSARRMNMTNGQRKLFTTRAPTLNPTYLNSYPEGRKATEKMKRHQERIIISNKNKKNLYRSSTEPINTSFRHSSGNKHFPKISKRHDGNSSPRVLVWGESDDGPGRKLVAVGDHVLANIRRDCSFHGLSSNEYTGYIKFIGFIEGNSQDVYIGLRLDDEVGNTDGRVEGRRYFRSEPRRGKFINLDDIIQVLESSTNHPATFTL